jgi:tRNA threonylcarbamoyladenosine biosynthesis protein TsaE
MRLELTSNGYEDTLKIAESIGRVIKGGSVIELRSDVGGGKTSFVKGLVKGMGSAEQVSSPTFTISKHYRASPDKGVTVHHFDFYRLSDPGLMKDELSESVNSPEIVTIVEWAGIVDDVLPEDRLVVELFATGEDSRLLHFESGEEHDYIVLALTS